MKGIINKLMATFLTLLVLFTTTSYSVEKHICGGNVYSVSLFGPAENCGMEGDYLEFIESNQSNDFNAVSNESCCHDEGSFLAGSTVQQDSGISFKTDKIYFLASYFLCSTQFVEINAGTSEHHKNYIPPLIGKDISVLYEVFRI